MPESYKKVRNLLFNLLDNTSDHIYFKDQDSQFIMMNKASAEWHKLESPKAAKGLTDFDIYKEEDACRMLEDERKILESGEALLGIEEYEVWQNGEDAWVSTSKMPLRDDAGEIIGTFGISRDITQHKKAEIRAARYAEENRQFRLRMEQELQIAGQLQKTFFPHTYPVFPRGVAPEQSTVQFHHCHFSGDLVGGDLCSIIPLSDTMTGIFLCDVMGHGVRSALGTALVRALVEEISKKERDPGRFLQRMNRMLYPMLRQDDELVYVTACYMVVDLKNGNLEMANAGHPMPVVIAGDEADWMMEERNICGPALAIFEEIEYQTICRKLNPGDSVVMFTDGVCEVDDGTNHEFGEEGLLKAFQRHHNLPLKQLIPHVLNEVLLFSGKESFEDDVCLVGFQLCQTSDG